MIIIRLMGGLGNQMFQYAFGRYLAYKNNTELKLDTNFFTNQPQNKKDHVFRNYDLDIFNIKEDFATGNEVFRLSKRSENILLDKILNKILGHKKTFIVEPHFHFSTSVYNAPDNSYLSGYWQTEKYFAKIDSLIRSEFTYKEDLADNAKALKEKISTVNSVCVNVRRGDFLTNDNLGFRGIDYFQKAERIIQEKIPDPVYYIFSDEIEWCKANLKFDAPAVYVTHDFAGRKFQDYLRLMASCKHYIIPNSSFAWWAVWFNKDIDKIVVAPKLWFNNPSLDTKDLIPANWIRV